MTSIDHLCPPGMYPFDSNWREECATFAELRAQAESWSNDLNLPISWTIFDELVNDDNDDFKMFELVFIKPRKGGDTWSLCTSSFDRAEVQAWLDAWIPTQIGKWFGWATDEEIR